jgi:hypothetical protein
MRALIGRALNPDSADRVAQSGKGQTPGRDVDNYD